MKFIYSFLVFLGMSQVNLFGMEQFMLRFSEAKSHIHLQTGCYGTASYRWIGPSIDTLERHKHALKEHALQNGLNGIAWSSTKDSANPGHYFVFDLETEEAISTKQLPLTQNKALVFCQCRNANLKNCNQSGLAPLAGRESFFSFE